MLNKLILILLLVCATSINIAFAESVPPADTSIKTDAPEITTINTDITEVEIKEELSELEAYKLLYENQKEANEKILDTTFWALGLAVTVLIFILSANLLNNVRSKRNETELLSSQFNNELEKIRTHFLGEMEKSIRAEFELLKKSTNENLNEKLDKFQSNLESMVNTNIESEERLTNRVDGEIKILKLTIQSIKSKLSDFENKLKMERFYSNGMIARLQGDLYIGKITVVPLNALRFYIEAVEQFSNANLHGRYELILGDIIEILESGVKSDKFIRSDFNDMFIKIQDIQKNKTSIDKIKELVM